MEFNGTFFVSIISFVVFVFLMNKVLYSPMRKIVADRKNFIDTNYELAETNKLKAEKLSDEREQKIRQAKNDAHINYNNIINGFKEQKINIVAQANQQTNDELENAYEHLYNVSNETKNVLKTKMTDLANDIVEKILGYRSEVQGFDNDAIDKILYH